MSVETCHVCAGPMRITVIPVFARPFMGVAAPTAAQAVSTCRDDPSHDAGGVYLVAVLAKRASVGEAAWMAGHDPNPWES